MTQEDKDLLIKDLCCRLPYKVKCKIDLQGFIDICDEYKEKFEKAKIVIPDLFNRIDKPYYLWLISGDRANFLGFDGVDDYHIPIELVKPYLFPLSSMTEEHKKEFYSKFCWEDNDEGFQMTACHHSYALGKINWLLEHHYDINYLIPTNLAIDCTNLNIY
jgi:hypothetical protein